MKPRLLQLVHGYPPAIGGVEVNVRDICERLVARFGYDVTVFTTNAYTNANFRKGSLPTIPIVDGEGQNGVHVRRFPVVTGWSLPLRALQKGFYTFRLPGNDRLRTWYQGPISPEMLRATVDFPCDVICAASFPLNHMTYPFRRPAPRPPVVLIGAVHSSDAWGYRRRHLINLIRDSYAYVAHTEHERNWLVEQGAPEAKLRVIPHGIEIASTPADPARFRSEHGIPPEAFLVAYVGQQGGHKGIEVLMDVFPRLLQAEPKAWLVVAGSRTPYSAVLRRREQEMPAFARERFRILDDIPPAVKSDLLAACDVFASPSGHESFGITILEAWAFAKPVVVADIPAVRQVVENYVTGFLVPYRDRRRLHDRLLALAADPARRREVGEAGLARLRQRHTIDAEAARYNGLFREAVAYGSPHSTRRVA